MNDTIEILIVCITVLLIILGCGFLIYLEDKYDTPYEKCLEGCRSIERISLEEMECIKDCKELVECGDK